MKLTQKTNNKAIKSGMTLLELTVVILVLLSLIAILFVGARAWKKGSDKAGCIMNIRNVQQAVRGHINMNNMAGTAAMPAVTAIYGTGTDVYLPAPSCPAGGTYSNPSYATVSAFSPGNLFVACSLQSSASHLPSDYATW